MSGEKLIPYRREHTGDAAQDRAQRVAQQVALKTNAIAGRYVGAGFFMAVTTVNVTTASATFADLANLTLSLTAQPGDVLVIDFPFVMQISAAATFGYAQIAVVDGGNTYASTNVLTDTLGAYAFTTGANATNGQLSGLWTVRSKGIVTVKIRGMATGGSTLTVYGSASSVGTPMLRVQQMRKVS